MGVRLPPFAPIWPRGFLPRPVFSPLLLIIWTLFALTGCRSDAEERAHSLIADAVDRSAAIVAVLEAHPGDEETVLREFGKIRQKDPDSILRYREEQKTLWENLDPRDRAHFQDRIEAVSPALEKALSAFSKEAQARLSHAIATIN